MGDEKLTLYMTYKTTSGEEVTYSLSDARDDLTAKEVKDYMADCISKNVFITKHGDLAEIASAEKRLVTISKLDVINAA